MECNAVFEGGGIRGIAHVGAASVLQQAGYHMRYFAGSSAGAIVASLLAAGYTADELRPIMQELEGRRPPGRARQDGKPFHALWHLRRRSV